MQPIMKNRRLGKVKLNDNLPVSKLERHKQHLKKVKIILYLITFIHTKRKIYVFPYVQRLADRHQCT